MSVPPAVTRRAVTTRLVAGASALALIGAGALVAVTAGLVLAVASGLRTPARASAPAPQVIGHSVQGRNLLAYHLGDPGSPVKAVLLGEMHGDERAGVSVVSSLLAQNVVIAGIDLWVVPTLNPDGYARNTRQNAHGVDLNRNWPNSWIAQGGQYYSGPRALSEPETQAMYAFLNRVKPRYLVSLHQPLNGVDSTDGGARDPAFRTPAGAGPAPGGQTLHLQRRLPRVDDGMGHELPERCGHHRRVPGRSHLGRPGRGRAGHRPGHDRATRPAQPAQPGRRDLPGHGPGFRGRDQRVGDRPRRRRGRGADTHRRCGGHHHDSQPGHRGPRCPRLRGVAQHRGGPAPGVRGHGELGPRLHRRGRAGLRHRHRAAPVATRATGRGRGRLLPAPRTGPAARYPHRPRRGPRPGRRRGHPEAGRRRAGRGTERRRARGAHDPDRHHSGRRRASERLDRRRTGTGRHHAQFRPQPDRRQSRPGAAGERWDGRAGQRLDRLGAARGRRGRLRGRRFGHGERQPGHRRAHQPCRPSERPGWRGGAATGRRCRPGTGRGGGRGRRRPHRLGIAHRRAPDGLGLRPGPAEHVQRQLRGRADGDQSGRRPGRSGRRDRGRQRRHRHVDVRVDVLGYISSVPGGPDQPGTFVITDPTRVVDTRTGLGAGRLGPRATARIALPRCRPEPWPRW